MKIVFNRSLHGNFLHDRLLVDPPAILGRGRCCWASGLFRLLLGNPLGGAVDVFWAILGFTGCLFLAGLMISYIDDRRAKKSKKYHCHNRRTTE
ncbi:MAG: hypothetical protein A2527_14215 [Candidatus Lambdaproteobacteria bacterium RIFOXYD2_FULL_50_16]|uniref:Uncharacterized protein n=1 Tax=Candidatus Lambdaproteobacteria bacterium RIFOXYD2_FULL_50_16 TaxID=1817772 RepID=A0A1F6G4N7_9PROT|nr:MAG: hypothetical protein A2527_14215 [Candidatus Lambdaproteobacteria bacterium RIFOXYD2_FULL_50_16]